YYPSMTPAHPNGCGVGLVCQRQSYRDAGAFTKCARDIELTPVALDDVLHDRQSQPGAARSTTAAGIGAIESSGEMGNMLGRDAFALVTNRHDCRIPSTFIQAHDYGRLGRTVFEGVFHQVADQLFQLITVSPDNEIFIRHHKLKPVLPFSGGPVPGGPLDEWDEV